MSNLRTNAEDLMSAWPRATEEQRANALAALTGESSPAAGSNFPSVLSPRRVAELTSLSTRSLRDYARRGLLRPAYVGGAKKRCWGYSAASVRAFIENAIGG